MLRAGPVPGVGMGRFPIASKQLIIAHLSGLMVKIWSQAAAVSGEGPVWRQLAVLARLRLASAGLRRSGLVGRRISVPFRLCAVSIRLLEQLKSQWLCWGPDSDGCQLHLGQVGGQVVGGPAVAGSERLGPGGLSVRHDAEPVIVGLEGHNPVVPDPELFPGAGEVREAFVW